MFLLLLLSLFIAPVYPQNTCSINALSPATTCVYCALAGSVTIGANTTTSSPTQVLNVGLYSATHNYGKQVPTPTPQTINAWTQSNTVNVGVVSGSVTTQSLIFGTYSSEIRIGNPTDGPATTQAITIGASGTAAPGQTINLGPRSNLINIGGNAAAGVNIATSLAGTSAFGRYPSPTPYPTTQDIYLGDASNNVYLGDRAVSTIGIGTLGAPTINMGKTTPSPTPQSVTIARYSTGVTIGNDMTGDIFIGRLITGVVYIGRVDHTTASNIIVIGQNNAPPSPTPAPVQIVYMGRYSASVQIGEYAASMRIGVAMPASSVLFVGRDAANTDSTTIIIGRYTSSVIVGTDQPHSPTWPGQSLSLGPYTSSISIGTSQAASSAITIGNTSPTGAPSSPTSSKINLRGLYHYFYSGACQGNAGTSPAVLDCNVGTAQANSNDGYVTNAAVGAGVTSGYDTTNNRWYPPEAGHYLVTGMGLAEESTAAYIQIKANVASGGETLIVHAHAGVNSGTRFITLHASAVVSFNAVGSGNYIILLGQNTLDGSFSQEFTRLTISRIA